MHLGFHGYILFVSLIYDVMFILACEDKTGVKPNMNVTRDKADNSTGVLACHHGFKLDDLNDNTTPCTYEKDSSSWDWSLPSVSCISGRHHPYWEFFFALKCFS